MPVWDFETEYNTGANYLLVATQMVKSTSVTLWQKSLPRGCAVHVTKPGTAASKCKASARRVLNTWSTLLRAGFALTSRIAGARVYGGRTGRVLEAEDPDRSRQLDPSGLGLSATRIGSLSSSAALRSFTFVGVAILPSLLRTICHHRVRVNCLFE
jgi:hypothetical protein